MERKQLKAFFQILLESTNFLYFIFEQPIQETVLAECKRLTWVKQFGFQKKEICSAWIDVNVINLRHTVLQHLEDSGLTCRSTFAGRSVQLFMSGLLNHLVFVIRKAQQSPCSSEAAKLCCVLSIV